jgi:hypothetical protein
MLKSNKWRIANNSIKWLPLLQPAERFKKVCVLPLAVEYRGDVWLTGAFTRLI